MRILLVIKGDVGAADLPLSVYKTCVVESRAYRAQHDETFMEVTCDNTTAAMISLWFAGGTFFSDKQLLFFNRLVDY